MKTYIPILTIVSLLVTGCQNPVQESTELTENPANNTTSISSDTLDAKPEFVLPTYGSSDPLPVGSVVTEYEARNEGRLTIKNGCVTLTYPKDYYKESTAPDDFASMPIFPGYSKFIDNGQAIEVNDKIYRDGDYVEMSGRGTIREFWTSYPSDMEYVPVPDHCIADEYWEVGGTGLYIMD
ncbi:hypothetical protein [Psychrobacter sp. BF1]|uniref:hypothetical protein n=1 Tax=Psychrobacter sp. BF1 TaxID=2821147 RepID=UPI001C4E131C|nr:hypothetical protein [Psychrobacter sp. BF1]